MNRRSFLQRGATALALGRATLAAAEPAPIPIGFLGVAYSHAAEKIRLLRASGAYRLIGVWAENPTLAETYRSQGVPVLEMDDLLGQCRVVAVESEVARHAELAARALEAGCHVHLEKPPALHLAEFDRVIRLAREKQRLVQVGYMWRHHPGLRTVFEAARKGWLGQVYLVRAMLNTSLDAPRRAEWARFPGGVLYELGSHFIDAIVRFLGRPTRVQSFLRSDGALEDGLADNNLAVLEYPGAMAMLSSSALQPNAFAHRSFEVLGTRGTARVQPMEPASVLLDLAEAAGPYVKGKNTPEQPVYRRYEAEFEALARAIHGGGPLAVSLEEERTVQETLLRACGAG